MTRRQIVATGLYIYACLLLAGHAAVYVAALISGREFWTGLIGVPFILFAATGVLYGELGRAVAVQEQPLQESSRTWPAITVGAWVPAGSI